MTLRKPCDAVARCGDAVRCGECRLIAKNAAFNSSLTRTGPITRVVSQPVAVGPCPHLGAPTGETVECPTCFGRVRLKVLACTVHGRCTIGTRAAGVPGCCAGCPDRPAVRPRVSADRVPAPPRAALAPFPDRLTWVPTAQLVADSIALAGLAPADCAGVVGVPRSGMLPASVIAMHLHLVLGEIDAGGKVRWLAHGTRGGGGLLKPTGPVLVVDDTVFGGGATRRAREQLAGVPAVYAAVYARPEAAGVVDLYARELREPHLLEWNYPNNGRVGGLVCEPAHYGHAAATDLDGVLVHDEFSGGPIGTVYLAPRLYPVKLIVTGRHERHRAATEADLRRVGVRWERLVMLPDGVPLTTETAAAHKARHFKESRFGFFIESCPDQARLIFEAAKKPVICPRAGKVFQ